MVKCNDKDLTTRGGSNAQQTAYQSTVATYSSGSSALGDNTASDIPCLSSTSIGDIVYINNTTAEPALASTYTTSRAIGIIVNKPTTTTCDITTVGPLTLAALGSLSPLQTYYLSDVNPGSLTTTPTATSGNYVIQIGTALSSGTLNINIQRIVKRA